MFQGAGCKLERSDSPDYSGAQGSWFMVQGTGFKVKGSGLKVQSMSREDLEKMSSEELLKLGEPLLDITNHTIKLSDETLQKPSRTLSGIAESIRSITREEHSRISREVEQILSADKNITTRNLDTDDVREVLLNINGGVSTKSATCESLFNHWGGYIHLYPGDNLNIANDLCPAGSIFYVYNGTHNNQYVNNSKDGNYWLGAGGVPILDGQIHGQNFRARAFNGGMKNNIIAFLEIQYYTDHGIYSTSSASTNIASVVIVKWMDEKKDTLHFFGLPGADEGEIKLYNGRRQLKDNAGTLQHYDELEGYKIYGVLTSTTIHLQGQYTYEDITIDYDLSGKKVSLTLD